MGHPSDGVIIIPVLNNRGIFQGKKNRPEKSGRFTQAPLTIPLSNQFVEDLKQLYNLKQLTKGMGLSSAVIRKA